jgi:DNA-binding XRE family transcriptional regulator
MLTALKLAAQKKPKKMQAWNHQKVIFSCCLHTLRKNLGLTLRDVSKCGVDIATIARAERGHEIHLSHALRLAALFERSVSDIWKEVEARKAKP